MWTYSKKLQYPVKIKTPNPAMAKIVMTQLGGPDGELGAAMRYLHQRYSCPYGEVTGILTDIGVSYPLWSRVTQTLDLSGFLDWLFSRF